MITIFDGKKVPRFHMFLNRFFPSGRMWAPLYSSLVWLAGVEFRTHRAHEMFITSCGNCKYSGVCWKNPPCKTCRYNNMLDNSYTRDVGTDMLEESK